MNWQGRFYFYFGKQIGDWLTEQGNDQDKIQVTNLSISGVFRLGDGDYYYDGELSVVIMMIIMNEQYSPFYIIVSSQSKVFRHQKCDGVLANVLYGDNNIEESYQR